MNATRDSQRRAVYVISVAAELAGVHPQTLRIYERKGLLEPARTVGGSRRYSDADIAQLQRIQELGEDTAPDGRGDRAHPPALPA
jgi:MerR family transcriptional regulator/heat shock protein HspR